MLHMKPFHRTLILAILLVTLCCLPPCAQAAVSAETSYNSSTPFLYTIGYQGYWIMSSGTLFWCDNDAREMQSVVTRNDIVVIAASSEEQSSYVYYLTESESGAQVLHAVLSGGNVMYDHSPLPEDMRIVQMEAGAACLYALDEAGVLYQVLPSFDGPAAANELIADGWSNEDITTFALYGDWLLIYQADSDSLTLLDLSENTSRPNVTATVTAPSLRHMQFGTMDGDMPLAIVICEENGVGKLALIRMDDSSYVDTGISLPDDISLLERDKTTLYIRGRNDTMLYTLPLSGVTGIKENSTLTIVNILPSGSRLDIATSMFHQKYPDIEIEFRAISDPRILATEMMAGTDGIDIIGIQDSWMTISTAMLLRSGAFLDLNQFEELAATKEYYRDIWGWVTISDCWFAVPEGPVCHPWQVNFELAGKLGWELPEGRWSWADFMELANCVEAYNETTDQPIALLQDDSFLLPYFFHEYQANHVNAYDGVADYSSDAYIGLLEMWRSLNDRGLIGQATGIAFEMKPNTLLCSGRRTTLYAMKSDCYILPPTETETSLYPVYATGALALNANSQHLEEAVYFLTCYMSVEAESGRWVFNYGKWLKDDSVYPDYANDPFLHIELPSDENEELWDYMLEHSSPELYLYDIMRQQGNTLLSGLLDGTVTPKQFAQISQQLADMMLGE